VTPLPGWSGGGICKTAGGGISSCGSVFNNQLADGARNV
jgi:hypothetical protein